jgi:hypothetical protein
MSSRLRFDMLVGRSGNSVKYNLRPLAGFQPGALERCGSFISDFAGGVHSGLIHLATNVVDASGTATLSSFKVGDTLTIGGKVFGASEVPTHNYLASAATYAALAKTAVTNTGLTVLKGDLAGATITGFPPGTATGSVHYGDATWAAALVDSEAAWVALAARTPATDLSATSLGGYTAVPGNYSTSGAATWTAGALTLDAGGNPAAEFVFQIGTSLTMPANGSVVLINGAQENNVYFITGTTFIFGATCTVYGTIIAGTAITFAASSILHGHALVRGGTGGTSITFPSAGAVTVVSGTPTSNPIVIGATDTITAANIAAAINADPSLNQVVIASSSGAVVTITSIVGGVIGNYIPLAISADGTVTGTTLTGGSQDAEVVMYNGIREPGTGVTI